MKHRYFLKNRIILVIITVAAIIFSVTISVSIENQFFTSTNGQLEDLSAEPIWIYDSELNIKHVETADLNDDGIGDNPYIIDEDTQDAYPLGDFLSLDQNPTAIIDSISPNPAIEDENIAFNGHGVDDGSIIAWEWRSSKDGVFGSSADISASSLSTGTHTIQFRVKDDQFQWSDYDEESLTINVLPETVNLDSGKIILSLDVSAKIYSEIDIFVLKDNLKGRSLAETKIFLENQPEITKIKVEFWPFWVRRVPEDLDKIEFNLRID